MGKVQWHDLLAFSRHWGTPSCEVYSSASSAWVTGTLDSGLFAHIEKRAVQQIDGTTATAIRWTWHASACYYSYPTMWFIGVAYHAVVPNKAYLIETSADGTTWTQRHGSSGDTTTQGAVFLEADNNGGDTYIRLTIAVSNSTPLSLSSIRAMTGRWGDQAAGSEYEYPYAWDTTPSIFPLADNTSSLGTSSKRWSTVYAGTGSINTSGAAAKTDIRPLSDSETAVAMSLAANVRLFRFRDAVVAKGAAARLHAGMIFEDVVAAFAAEGLDPARYGIVCSDPAMKTVTRTRMVTDADGNAAEQSYDESVPDLDESGVPKAVVGLRYDELAQFVLAGLAARLTALEAH